MAPIGIAANGFMILITITKLITRPRICFGVTICVMLILSEPKKVPKKAIKAPKKIAIDKLPAKANTAIAIDQQ